MSTLRQSLPAGWRRVCFRLQVDPDRIEEYRQRHAVVWPDMLRALHESGWNNYSLFLDTDGTLIGYFETPSLDDALAGMAEREVNARWQAEMGEFFIELDAPPDQGFVELDEVFQLESQLARTSATDSTPRSDRTHPTDPTAPTDSTHPTRENF